MITGVLLLFWLCQLAPCKNVFAFKPVFVYIFLHSLENQWRKNKDWNGQITPIIYLLNQKMVQCWKEKSLSYLVEDLRLWSFQHTSIIMITGHSDQIIKMSDPKIFFIICRLYCLYVFYYYVIRIWTFRYDVH